MPAEQQAAVIETLGLCPCCYGWPLDRGRNIDGVWYLDCPHCGRKDVRRA